MTENGEIGGSMQAGYPELSSQSKDIYTLNPSIVEISQF
jgi:hypothetical protein